ncbi:MAG: phage tail assembly protein [Rubrivivax sp.]|nr:MAG: phage tail assembly protein [Rubrivivax sp.]
MSTIDPASAADAAEATSSSPAQPSHTVTLDTPIQRGAGPVTHVTLRKPKAGELRGVSLTELLQMDVTALQAVIPRISQPTLTKQEVAGMDPADLVQIGVEVTGFLLPKGSKEAESPTA